MTNETQTGDAASAPANPTPAADQATASSPITDAVDSAGNQPATPAPLASGSAGTEASIHPHHGLLTSAANVIDGLKEQVGKVEADLVADFEALVAKIKAKL